MGNRVLMAFSGCFANRLTNSAIPFFLCYAALGITKKERKLFNFSIYCLIRYTICR